MNNLWAENVGKMNKVLHPAVTPFCGHTAVNTSSKDSNVI